MAAEEALLSELPQSKGNHNPEGGGDGDHEPGTVAGQKTPEDERKSHQSKTAERGSSGVDAGSHAATMGSVITQFPFAFFFVTLDQGNAGGKDGGEGEEESAECGAVMPCDQAGQHGGRAAEEEADQVLMGFGLLQRRQFNLDHLRALG